MSDRDFFGTRDSDGVFFITSALVTLGSVGSVVVAEPREGDVPPVGMKWDLKTFHRLFRTHSDVRRRSADQIH